MILTANGRQVHQHNGLKTLFLIFWELGDFTIRPTILCYWNQNQVAVGIGIVTIARFVCWL